MPTTLEIYEHLKPKLGERETRELLEWIESEKLHLATKDDLKVLATKEELNLGLKEVEVRILRWMVTLWVTQMLAILALFFKK